MTSPHPYGCLSALGKSSGDDHRPNRELPLLCLGGGGEGSDSAAGCMPSCHCAIVPSSPGALQSQIHAISSVPGSARCKRKRGRCLARPLQTRIQFGVRRNWAECTLVANTPWVTLSTNSVNAQMSQNAMTPQYKNTESLPVECQDRRPPKSFDAIVLRGSNGNSVCKSWSKPIILCHQVGGLPALWGTENQTLHTPIRHCHYHRYHVVGANFSPNDDFRFFRRITKLTTNQTAFVSHLNIF